MLRRTITAQLFIAAIALPILLAACPTVAQDVFYYRKGKKVALTVKPEKNYVLFESDFKKEDLVRSFESTDAVLRQFQATKPLTGLNLAPGQAAPRLNWAIIDSISFDALARQPVAKKILYAAPFLITKDKKEVGCNRSQVGVVIYGLGAEGN